MKQKDKKLAERQVFAFKALFDYALETSRELGEKKAFELLSKVIEKKRLNWFERNRKKFDLKKRNATTARKVFEAFLKEMTPNWKEEQFKVIEENKNVSVMRFSGFCPILEASKKRNIEAENACIYCSERATRALMKKIHPKMRITIVSSRPKTNYCEEIIVMDTKKVNEVISAFLQNKEKILLLKRSQKLFLYPNKWNCIAGYVNEINPLERAYKEIKEETGIARKNLKLLKKGKKLLIIDKKLKRKWIVYPFLFESLTKKVKLDWEHSEARWIKPKDMIKFDTTFNLCQSFKRVME